MRGDGKDNELFEIIQEVYSEGSWQGTLDNTDLALNPVTKSTPKAKIKNLFAFFILYDSTQNPSEFTV